MNCPIRRTNSAPHTSPPNPKTILNKIKSPDLGGTSDHELLGIAKRAKGAGGRKIGYNLVRLNGQIADIFTDWIRHVYPDRADRVLNRIRDCRGGELGEKRFGIRQPGEGELPRLIKEPYRLARRKFFLEPENWPAYDYSHFEQRRRPQLRLF